MSGVTADVIPFSTVMGNRAKLSGINILGFKKKECKKKKKYQNLEKLLNIFFLIKKTPLEIEYQRL